METSALLKFKLISYCHLPVELHGFLQLMSWRGLLGEWILLGILWTVSPGGQDWKQIQSNLNDEFAEGWKELKYTVWAAFLKN